MRSLTVLGALVLGGMALSAGMAQACERDGKPSLSVNGRLVKTNFTIASQNALATWAPFVARGSYPVGRTLTLAEDRANVLTTLAPSAAHAPWRWRFGDGTAATGYVTHHAYRHRGTFVVGVDVYLVGGKYKAWYTFDEAIIHIG